MDTAEKHQKMHIGRKISRIREIRGMKQDALALELGVSQQQVSKLEQSEHIEEEVLERIAEVLGVSSESIKSFNEEAIVNYFNTFNDSSVNHGPFGNYHCTFNPLDKMLELVEENKKLYERLLASEREKVELLKNQ